MDPDTTPFLRKRPSRAVALCGALLAITRSRRASSFSAAPDPTTASSIRSLPMGNIRPPRSVDGRDPLATGGAPADAEFPPRSRWHHMLEGLLGRLHDPVEGEAVASNLRGYDAVVSVLNIDDGEIDYGTWVRPFRAPSARKIEEMAASGRRAREDGSTDDEVPKAAVEAIRATRRWSSDFVRRLHLCPWAGASLEAPAAIRYWVLVLQKGRNDGEDIVPSDARRAAVLDGMEAVVREAGLQLAQITTPSVVGDGIDPIDPSVAIAFIILVDGSEMMRSSRPSAAKLLPDFGSFHEFFLDLEDRLLDECDDYWDDVDDRIGEEGGAGQGENSPVGCKITIAAFHPQWRFGQDEDDSDDGSERPVDFEKRAPYPTISCVMSEAIEALGREEVKVDRDADGGSVMSHDSEVAASAPATERIAASNERTLEGIGVKRLREIFEEEVVGCPMNEGGKG